MKRSLTRSQRPQRAALALAVLLSLIASSGYSLSSAARRAAQERAANTGSQNRTGQRTQPATTPTAAETKTNGDDDDEVEPENANQQPRGRIAFASDRDDNFEIYVMNPDGSGQTRLTNDPADDTEPAWSPDGTRLVFVSTRDGNSEMYTMNADGTNQTRLTNNPAADLAPAWSPDGNQIAFHSGVGGGDDEIFVIDANSSTPVTAPYPAAANRSNTPAGDDIEPAWSPNGQMLAFASRRDGQFEIYTMNADGTNQTRLTNNTFDDSHPHWSPGSTQLITFQSDRDGNEEIYVMRADGMNQANLTNNAALDVQPARHSDGSRLVFASDRDPPQGGSFEIFAATGMTTLAGLTTLTNTPGFTNFQPAVQPLALPATSGVRLFFATLEGAQEVPPANSPARGIGIVMLSADETTARVSLTFSGLTTPQTMAHIHRGPIGVNGPVIIPLPNGTFSEFVISPTAQQVADLKAGLLYFNVHTTMFPGGEIRGQINAAPPSGTIAPPSNAFALTTNNRLLNFNTANPNMIVSSTPITGLQTNESLLGIDIRPATGQLYGLGSSSRLYTINTATGAATQVGAGQFAVPLNGSEFGFDFNPVVDRIRVVSNSRQNLRLNPDTGAVVDFDPNTAGTQPDGQLTFAPSPDPNAGAIPQVSGAAYTNNFAGATSTTLYDIDYNLDVLVTQNPPNNGTLNTVGPLGVNTGRLVGFDISAGSGNTNAFAALTAPDDFVSRLYVIDLATGAATLIGDINSVELVRDIAVGATVFSGFSATSFTVAEGAGRVDITVNRSGDLSGTATICYETFNGTANDRTDYTTALGTLRFAAGEASKTFPIFITDDRFVEQAETFSVTLSGPLGAAFNGPTTVTVTITDNDPAPATAVSTVRTGTGVNAAGLQAVVDQFRADLGGSRNPGGATSFATGRREISWDGVPDAASAPNNLPADFFNTTALQGAVFSTPGTGFQVSADSDNPTNTPVEFGNLNASYPATFGTFSPQRLFTALGSNITDVTFFIPGTNFAATVSGFGVVFTDVDTATTARVQFFDADGAMLAEVAAPVSANTGNQGLSFAGVTFSNRRIARVRIFSGGAALGPDDVGGSTDKVAMDDFIYGEPQTAATAVNPIDETLFFVRQQYIDFLNREPDPDGFNAWVSLLNRCPDRNNDPSCDRITVSAAFFLSPEFQSEGFFIIRFYLAAFNRLPTYREFIRDLTNINGPTAAERNANRDAFPGEFVQAEEFRSAFDRLSNAAFVDRLATNAGVTLANRDQLVADLNAGTRTRAQVLREVVENTAFTMAAFNRAFVLSEYFGYLRRDPDPAGFQAWLDFLNANPNDFRTMVNGFVNSIEYRSRFGQP